MLVFSQFTSLLALLRAELDAQQIAHCYLDGSMPTRARQAEVDRFQSSPDVPLFLLSLKAGGTGLNLTGADTVVHFDPWWNPAAEAQATDRAHRIGQKRVVTSYKLIASGTVEEKVLALQAEKRALLAGVFEASDAAATKLSLADLKSLNVAFLVGLAFAVAASANVPSIVLTLFWRRFNTAGLLCGMLIGLISSVVLIVLSPAVMGLQPGKLIHRGAIFPLENPAIVSVPLGFLGAVMARRLGAD